MSLLLRPSRADDAETLARSTHWHVAHGTGTFELDPVDAHEMGRRRVAVVSAGLPWLVAERDGHVVGYAYAASFRARPAYRYFLEDSIYLAPEARGQGVGRLLLAELVAPLRSAGCAPAARGDRRLGQRAVDRPAPGARLPAHRRAAGGRLEIRPLGGCRVHAAPASAPAPAAPPQDAEGRAP